MRRICFAGLLLLASCAALQRPAGLAPLRDEGEVSLYLLPFPREADPLSFALASISAETAAGAAVPLELAGPRLRGAELREQRILATGRLAPGEYRGLLVQVSRAALDRQGEPASDLLVPQEPVRIAFPFTVRRRAAQVLWLALRYPESVEKGYRFSPSFGVSVPAATPAQRAGFCSDAARHQLALFDAATGLVTGVVPTGRSPRGLALDALAGRVYAAASGEDLIEVVDVASGERRRSIRLLGGDGPTRLALTADGALLLSANSRSRTVSFFDTGSLGERGRVQVGEDPAAILLDRLSRRAYVFNRKSSTISVLDLANRVVAGTVATDPEPLQGALSRDGTRLYAIFAGSNYMSVLSVPGLQPVGRVFVGLGATAIHADPRTDQIYVARAPERRISVYDAYSALPVDEIPVEGAVEWMTIDDDRNALLALVPSRRAIVAWDLTSRQPRATIPIGAGSFDLSLAHER